MLALRTTPTSPWRDLFLQLTSTDAACCSPAGGWGAGGPHLNPDLELDGARGLGARTDEEQRKEGEA